MVILTQASTNNRGSLMGKMIFIQFPLNEQGGKQELHSGEIWKTSPQPSDPS